MMGLYIPTVWLCGLLLSSVCTYTLCVSSETVINYMCDCERVSVRVFWMWGDNSFFLSVFYFSPWLVCHHNILIHIHTHIHTYIQYTASRQLEYRCSILRIHEAGPRQRGRQEVFQWVPALEGGFRWEGSRASRWQDLQVNWDGVSLCLNIGVCCIQMTL